MIVSKATPARRLSPLPIGLLYYPGVRCPSCGGRHFAVGRLTAECAACEAALVLSNPSEEVLTHG
jgi:hypothetical protein